MTSYRLWPSTNGPATATAFGGSFISGTSFFVSSEAWLEGYWWWVAPTGQATTPVKCALWMLPTYSTTGQLVPGSVVTSGTLTAGQWNFVPLTTPVPLSVGGSTGTASQSGGTGGAIYTAAIGVNGNFPDTNNYWGAGQTAPAGITNGPLTAYSAPSASMPPPNGLAQGCFSTGGSDPSTTQPVTSSNTDNFWVDVQVRNLPPAGYTGSYRLLPNNPGLATGVNNDTTASVSGTAFSLSKPCSLTRIWLFSGALATGTPSRVGVWNSDTQTVVAGTDNSSPSWSGAAGSGWISVDYTSSKPTLQAGHYIVAFFNGSAVKCYADTVNFFFSGTDPVGGAAVGGPGWNGISWGQGILTAPNVANGPQLSYDDGSGTKPGQTAYTGPTAHVPTSTWVYPVGFEASSDWGEIRGVDVEVTPLPPVPLAAAGGGSSMFKRNLLRADL